MEKTKAYAVHYWNGESYDDNRTETLAVCMTEAEAQLAVDTIEEWRAKSLKSLPPEGPWECMEDPDRSDEDQSVAMDQAREAADEMIDRPFGLDADELSLTGYCTDWTVEVSAVPMLATEQGEGS